LLTILLAVAYGAAGQGYVIDSVCRGAERHYRIDGENGSTYSWSLTDPMGIVITLPETADTVTITWNLSAGDYILSTLQTSRNGCDSLELGTIKVFDLPLAYAGEDLSLCNSDPYTLADATASGYGSLRWTSGGDGTFSDTTAMNPTYAFGPSDIALGTVTLTLAANGLGRDGSCPPVLSALTITLNKGIVPVFASIGTLCQNSMPPQLPSVSTNGISGTWDPAIINTAVSGTFAYTFTADGTECTNTATLDISVEPGIIPVFATIGPLCLHSAPPTLSTTSLNGISGSWMPDTINTSSAGTATYTFTPNTGQCLQVTTLTIVTGSPEITEIQVSSSLNGLANGRATVLVTGSASPFVYSLNGTDWQTSNIFTKLIAGNYTAWAKDANGCMASGPFVILNTVTGEVGILAGNVLSCISLPIEIPVMAYNFTNISSFSIQLEFDTSILSFNSLTQVNSQLDNGVLSITVSEPGTLQISFTASDSITLLSEDMLFKINFYGMSAGYTQLQWDALICVIYSAFGYELPSIYTKGGVEITPIPLVYTTGAGDYCEGTPLTLSAGSLTSQNLVYTWISPDSLAHMGQELDLGALSLDASGQYQVTASDGNACTKTETLQVQVYPNPEITLSEYDTLCSDETIVLNPGPGYAAYLWQDGSTAPQLLPTAEGVYWVTVTDYNGCMDSDTVLLRPCELLIWIPNVFSPNGDGLNDEFIAKYNHRVSITFKMMIFNKWGEQLFSSDDISKGWDGTYKGVPCPPDNYTWVVSFEAPITYNFVQRSPQQGTVMLLK
jgi:gliding motility-associated-like protein